MSKGGMARGKGVCGIIGAGQMKYISAGNEPYVF